MQTRREFLKTSLIGTGGLVLGGLTLDSKIYARSQKANDTVMQGTKSSWTDVKDWYTKNGLETDEKLAYIEQQVDVWNYLNWCAVQIYTGNSHLLNCQKYRCELMD